ncbi:hypothetical protein CYMTET_13858 [Cymbomonas tetramitiformis]|uniref:Uncharacterized protein n=1 Tax=Cymbomonas tetramitiformis TaxID=36881 RepID=A0AAE0GHL5_9CHLO|nr:hypothetical protein CYMTET_13858 [Cymbomonas tetramitiformis]|eukprot:gene13860-16381_t
MCEAVRNTSEIVARGVVDSVASAQQVVGHKGRVFDAAAAPAHCPTPGAIATACEDGLVRVWQRPSAEDLLRVRACEKAAPKDEVLRVSWNNEGAVLACGGADGGVHVWSAPAPFRIDEPTPRGPLKLKMLDSFAHEGQCYVTDFDPSPHAPQQLFVGVEGDLYAWDCAVHRERYSVQIQSGEGDPSGEGAFISGAAMPSASGPPVLGLAVSDGTVRILSRDTGEEVGMVSCCRDTQANCASFSACGNHLAIGTNEGTVEIHDLRSTTSALCEASTGLEMGQGPIYSVRWWPTAGPHNMVLSASFKGFVAVWEGHTGRLLAATCKENFPIYGTALSEASQTSSSAELTLVGGTTGVFGTPFFSTQVDCSAI